MKISKILSGLMCAGILCTNVVEASVIAESNVAVDDLALTFFDAAAGGSVLTPGTAVGSEVVLSDVDISFTGTSISTTLNGISDADSYTTLVTDPFAVIAIDITSSQTSGASLASAESKLDGNILTTGADGITDSNVEVYGQSSGDANSQIINNLESIFAFSVVDDVWVDLSFDWMLDVLVSVFDDGGTGVATWDLTVKLENDCIGFGCGPALIDFDLSSTVGADQSGTLNDVGDLFDETVGASFSSGRVLLAAGAYTLNINQNTSAAANSVDVPAPASLAILGLSLLGVAVISRKKTNQA
jgi:hypothetical protein